MSYGAPPTTYTPPPHVPPEQSSTCNSPAPRLQLPQPNSALDALLVPRFAHWIDSSNDVPSDPQRIPRYPSLHKIEYGKLILSGQDAERYRREEINVRIQTIPVTELPAVTQLNQDYAACAERFYEAMVDMSQARDNPTSLQVRLLTKLKVGKESAQPHWSEKKVVAMSYKVHSLLIEGSTLGFQRTNNSTQMGMKDMATTAENMTISELHEQMCKAVRLEKAIVNDIMGNNEKAISNFIYAPMAYAAMKAKVRRDNEHKRDKLKAALDTLAVSAAPTSSTAPIGSAASSDYAASTTSDASAAFESTAPLSSTDITDSAASPVSVIPPSVYPRWDDLPADSKFTDMAAALAFLGKARERDMNGLDHDQYLPILKNNKLHFFIKIYDAIIDVVEIQTRPNSHDITRFVKRAKERKRPKYTVEQLQVVSWQLLEALIDGAENGFLVPESVEYARHKLFYLPKQTNVMQRLASILELLRREKSVVLKLLMGKDFMDEIVYQPYCVADMELEHRKNNSARAARNAATIARLSSNNQQPANTITRRKRQVGGRRAPVVQNIDRSLPGQLGLSGSTQNSSHLQDAMPHSTVSQLPVSRQDLYQPLQMAAALPAGYSMQTIGHGSSPVLSPEMARGPQQQQQGLTSASQYASSSISNGPLSVYGASPLDFKLDILPSQGKPMEKQAPYGNAAYPLPQHFRSQSGGTTFPGQPSMQWSTNNGLLTFSTSTPPNYPSLGKINSASRPVTHVPPQLSNMSVDIEQRNTAGPYGGTRYHTAESRGFPGQTQTGTQPFNMGKRKRADEFMVAPAPKRQNTASFSQQSESMAGVGYGYTQGPGPSYDTTYGPVNYYMHQTTPENTSSQAPSVTAQSQYPDHFTRRTNINVPTASSSFGQTASPGTWNPSAFATSYNGQNGMSLDEFFGNGSGFGKQENGLFNAEYSQNLNPMQ